MTTIAFIGGGNMATSLIGGLIADQFDAKSILVTDKDNEKLTSLSANFGIVAVNDNKEAAQRADVILLSVKPQIMASVAEEISGHLDHQPLIISIAAGIRESDLNHWLGGNRSLVRTMPNTPALVQTGATGMHANDAVSAEQKEQAESIMRAVGLTCWVESENTLDAITALSGSGPAYFFLVMEAMQAAGESMGIAPETAKLLTLQTALGAAKMAIESSDSPATLRQKVTSPGGTTEQALNSLMSDGRLLEVFHDALNKAKDRSIELSETLGKQHG